MDWEKIGEAAQSAIPSGLGLISSTVSGLVNNAISQSNAEAQRDWQEKMWHMQNQYNSPAAMAARMRAAGLNPYTMTGAQPAGSAGQGAMAQTLPLETPLSALRTTAEIRNINASTNVEESTVEKILRESELIRIGVERGLIDNQQAKKLIDEMWSAYEAAGYSGPTGFNIKQGETEIKNTESDTARNEAQIGLIGQQIAESEQKVRNLIAEEKYTEALTATEDLLRDSEKAYKDATTEDAKASALDHYRSAELKRIQALCEANDEKRKQALHPGTMEAQRLENSIKRYAREKGATEAQMRELDLYMQQLWSGKKHDYTWNDVGNMLLDFVHHNISLFGGANQSSSASGSHTTVGGFASYN